MMSKKAEVQNNKTQLDMDYVAEHPSTYDDMKYEEQKAIRDAVYAAVKTHINSPFEKKVLTYQGFDVVIPARMQPKEQRDREGKLIPGKEPIPYVFVKRAGSYYMEIESNAGITKRLNNLLEGLDETKKRQEKQLEQLEYQQKTLNEELKTNENHYVVEIEALKSELDEINKELGVVA